MLAAIERICNWLEAAPTMQDWEEQRELFPRRLRSAKRPPPRPRLRPNIFARIARYCTLRPMPVLLIAAFLLTAATTLAALGTNFDLARPAEIPVDPLTQSSEARYQAEFPAVASLMVIRVSADSAALAQNAAQFAAGKLAAKKADISHVLTPGLGPFYDRFGLLYLDAGEIAGRVERVKRLKPLFNAIAASPNLAGLSALVKEIAQAVQKGRSPQGLEALFVEMSGTIKNLASGRPAPLDWQRVAGLKVDTNSKEWAVVVEPREGRLQEARADIETLADSLLKSRPGLKITSDFPPEAKTRSAGSTSRQIVIAVLLSLLAFFLLVLATLRHAQSVILFAIPPVAAIAAAYAIAAFVAPAIDQTIATLAFATLLPVMAFSLPVVAVLRRPGTAGSSLSLAMLAAHEMGPLLLTLGGMICTTWFLWAILGFASLARLSAVVMLASAVGLTAALALVPSLSSQISKPQDELPADLFDQAAAQNLEAIWRKVRPPLAALIMAASLFCIVFFSSLNFSPAGVVGAEAPDAARGLQFMVEGEAAAEKLANDLQQIPEVGTVRWMGSFLPPQVEQKRKILQDLAGAIPGPGIGGAIGPYDLVAKLRELELGLRVITDEAGANESLRASAHELRRSLAVLLNTSKTVEQAAVELERLLFSGFGGLAETADGLSRLAAPRHSDFDPNLRALYVSENDRWRLEALPRRAISAEAFINAAKVVEDPPHGKLVTEQAALRALASTSKTALVFGFVFTLLIALAYLRSVVDWLIVVVASLLMLPLYAALVVTTATAISPATLPALVMSSLSGVVMAFLMVARKRQPRISMAAILLPPAATIAIVLPARLLHLEEFAAFASTLAMLLAAAVIFHLTVVPQICAWADRRRISGPGVDETRVAAQSGEDFSDDIF